MIDSRDPADLHPLVQKKLQIVQEYLKSKSIKYVVSSTYRDSEYQDHLYSIGRTTSKDKAVVTNAKGGTSYHNYRLAFDIMLLHGVTILPGTDARWQELGEAAKVAGLEWGGLFKKFVDRPHFQFSGGLSILDLQAGKYLDEHGAQI